MRIIVRFFSKIKMAIDSDSEVPELEGIDEKNISKSELKARKAMAKLGLRVVPDVSRVVIRRANNSLFVISPADVFKTANGDSKCKQCLFYMN